MLTTRCSACHTSFRVTEQQLAAKDGWVRCGRCLTVFDARSALFEPEIEAPHADDAVSASGARIEAALVQDTAVAESPAAMEPEPAAAGTARARETAGPDADGVQAPAIDHHPAAPLAESALATVHVPEFATDDRVEPALAREPEALAEPQAIQRAEFQHAEFQHDPLQEPRSGDRLEPRTEPESVADAKTGEPAAPVHPPPLAAPIRQDEPELLDFGPKPRKSRTALWASGSAVLLLAFGAQAAFQYRGTIALLLPESKPYLEQFCAEFGCELPLPRRAELMSIETSDLQGHPNNPAVMVLAATLRNRAPFPQAYPALELTLTDDRDQPLARRVLQPADYLAQGAARADGGAFAASSEQPVRVFLEASSLKATSYRLYLFHP